MMPSGGAALRPAMGQLPGMERFPGPHPSPFPPQRFGNDQVRPGPPPRFHHQGELFPYQQPHYNPAQPPPFYPQDYPRWQHPAKQPLQHGGYPRPDEPLGMAGVGELRSLLMSPLLEGEPRAVPGDSTEQPEDGDKKGDDSSRRPESPKQFLDLDSHKRQSGGAVYGGPPHWGNQNFRPQHNMMPQPQYHFQPRGFPYQSAHPPRHNQTNAQRLPSPGYPHVENRGHFQAMMMEQGGRAPPFPNMYRPQGMHLPVQTQTFPKGQPLAQRGATHRPSGVAPDEP